MATSTPNPLFKRSKEDIAETQRIADRLPVMAEFIKDLKALGRDTTNEEREYAQLKKYVEFLQKYSK